MPTSFKEVSYSLATLVSNIDTGIIGLPDIQRPFVWADKKVRDLFDSMYRGYPVGYLLFWENGLYEDVKSIGTDKKTQSPHQLIVDGQQRLTSLYAVMKNKEVVRENYDQEKITLSFKPIEGKFEVPDAAIKKSQEYIHDISRLWAPDDDIFSIVEGFTDKLEQTRLVSDDEKKLIKENVSRLQGLQHYPFSALELDASLSEEEVANIFVRINSQGKSLNMADFILTLMSVFWDDGRVELEAFCRKARVSGGETISPFNYIWRPDPDQLLKVSVGLGFMRGRLNYVYSILRGKDLETGEFSAERRDEQFKTLQEAQSRVLGIQNWHEFLKTLQIAGYINDDLISSQNNLLYSYLFFLIGRYRFDMGYSELKSLISRWYFMVSVTGRYTSSPETEVEKDLNVIKDLKTKDDFSEFLERTMKSKLTNDFWTIGLPQQLATSAARSPELLAYYASMLILDAKGLFSKAKVRDLLQEGLKSNKSAIERHHLFPKAYLERIGISDQKVRNQIANYALVEWTENIEISDTAPHIYAPKYLKNLTVKEKQEMLYWHALPDEWHEMKYEEFLEKRREKIARVIQDAFQSIGGIQELKEDQQNEEDDIAAAFLTLQDMLGAGEGPQTEFKETMLWNLKRNSTDPLMALAVVRAIASFANSSGGTLFIGVSDNGVPVGLENDYKLVKGGGKDGFELRLRDLLKLHFGEVFSARFVSVDFFKMEDVEVCRVTVKQAKEPVYVIWAEEGKPKAERFFVRDGARTLALEISKAGDYIKNHFG